MPNSKKRKNQARRRSFSWRWLLVAAFLFALFLLASRDKPKLVSQPTSSSATFDLAMQHLTNYRVEEAERVLLQVLASHPDSVRVRDELRWMYFNQFRHRELESLLEEGLRVRPQDLTLAVDLLMSEFRPQNPREVLPYWERTVGQQAEQPRVLATLAYCYARVGDADKAEEAFQVALNLGHSDILVRVRVAEFLIDRGDLVAAEQVLGGPTAADQLGSKDNLYQDQVWWNQSLIAESQADLTTALAHIDRALVRYPNELSYVQRRGTLLQRLDRIDEAASCFKHANELESHVGRLTEIVLSGDLENPTVALCREIADLCRQRGKVIQSETWKRAATYAGS